MNPKNPFEESQGIKPTTSGTEELRRLQKDIPRANLVPELRKLEEGKIGTKEARDQESDELKKEINGLVAFSIQEIWNGIKSEDGHDKYPGLKEWISQNPPGFLAVVHHQIFPATRERVLELVTKKRSAGEVLDFLKDSTLATFVEYMKRWYSYHENDQSQTYSNKAFARYLKVIEERKRLQPTASQLEKVPTQIEAGILTAMDVIWGTFRSIAPLYGRQYKRFIKKQELFELAKNSLPLALKIASTELGVFIQLREFSQEEGMDALRIIEENGKLKLDLTEEALSKIKIENPAERLRTGCPAIVAKGSDGRSMMFEMHEWLFKIAEEFYFPRVLKKF